MRQTKGIVSLGLVACWLIGFPVLAQHTLPNAMTNSRIPVTKMVLAGSRSKQKTDSLQQLTQSGYYRTRLIAQMHSNALAQARIAAESCTSYLCSGALSVSLTASGPLTCQQPQITLTVVGGPASSTYVFSAGATQPGGPTSSTATVTIAGPYSVTVTSPTGATATASVSVSQGPDLTPSLYASPTVQYGTTAFTVVVDVMELNGSVTSGSIIVKITKDAKVALSFPGSATSVGSRSVQNTAWSFDGASNLSYYILTTNQSVAAGDKLSFGLNGVLTPGATTGQLNLSTIIVGGTVCEMKLNNNTGANKIEYFQQ